MQSKSMAKTEAKNEVAFTVSLDSPEDLDVGTVADTLRDIETLLADIEKRVYASQQAKVKWTWPEEAQLEVVAKVNGMSRSQLSKIVSEAQKGFSEAKSAKGVVNWPQSFGESAKKSAQNILKKLSKLESITVKADNQKPIKITSAQITETLVASGEKSISAQSSIEGILDLISHRHSLKAAITQHGTGEVVQVRFPDEMLETVKKYFGKRVIAEGVVKYRGDGSPISITLSSTDGLAERKLGKPLIEYLGAAPDLAGGLSPEEFLARIRKNA